MVVLPSYVKNDKLLYSFTELFTLKVNLFADSCGKKNVRTDRAQQKLQFFMGKEESVSVCLLLLVGEEGQEAWGEVSTFSAYLTFSCLMFRNSTRLIGSQRWGSTKTHSRSLYMNHKEFPILILAGPSLT